jgi:hypothetical protein
MRVARRLVGHDEIGWPVSAEETSSFEPQVSSNSVDWARLANSLSLSNGVLIMQDTSPATRSGRFYRIIRR